MILTLIRPLDDDGVTGCWYATDEHGEAHVVDFRLFSPLSFAKDLQRDMMVEVDHLKPSIELAVGAKIVHRDGLAAMTTGAQPPESKFGTLEYWKDRSKKLEKRNAEAVASLKECLRVIEMLMPGLRYAVVQDYATINEAPIKAKRIVNKMERRESVANNELKENSNNEPACDVEKESKGTSVNPPSQKIYDADTIALYNLLRAAICSVRRE